jgi:hypothetical protein
MAWKWDRTVEVIEAIPFAAKTVHEPGLELLSRE